MPVVSISHLAQHVGETVTLLGWLYNKRSSGKLHFLEVRDGSGICQCVVFKGNVSPELFAQADHLSQETSLAVTGTVKEHGKIKGTYEIDATGLEVMAAPARLPAVGGEPPGEAHDQEAGVEHVVGPRRVRERHPGEEQRPLEAFAHDGDERFAALFADPPHLVVAGLDDAGPLLRAGFVPGR